MSAPRSPALILASTSLIRCTLLNNAGLTFSTEAPGTDEAALKQQLNIRGAADLALELAAQKSRSVSTRHPDALVIGADQTLELSGRSFDKPASESEARHQLMQLRGQTHNLHSALCCSRKEKLVWSHCSSAKLTMRHFSEAELDSYLALVGDKALHSVGGYQIEGPAIQLFSRIDGDYFTILGLPLLPLLEFLRGQGVELA